MYGDIHHHVNVWRHLTPWNMHGDTDSHVKYVWKFVKLVCMKLYIDLESLSCVGSLQVGSLCFGSLQIGSSHSTHF